MTVILPPSEIRLIIEKLAAYVVKNGPTFEDKILEKERHNPRFSFLYPNDPYHPYYQKRLQEYQDVGPDGLLARSRELEQSKNEKTNAVPAKVVKTEAPKEPETLDFVIDLPTTSALDYDIIKLTAQYVARNGRQFMLSLVQREMRNPQFDFLKPGHSLHTVFLKLVDQYSRVLLPSRSLIDKLNLYAHQRYDIIDRVIRRTEFTRYITEQHLREDAIAEKERLAYASIDWNDFVVVETIDFSLNDRNIELPKPLDHSTIVNMSIVQRRELWNGNTMPGVNPVPIGSVQDNEEEMEVDEVKPIAFDKPLIFPPAKRIATSSSFTNPPLPHHVEGIQIKHDYIPKAHISLSHGRESVESTETCPICSQSIAKSQIAEHMRIEALDPKWKEQRERYLAKHQETNYVVSGVDVSQNLQTLAKVRSELAGMKEEEIARKLTEANRIVASQTVIWDGRTDPHSIGQATREAMQKAKPKLQSQIDALNQQKFNEKST